MTGEPVFVIGSYMHAFVVRAARFPREGETVFGTDSEIGPGGKGENQAIAAARQGAQVTMLAAVGQDSFGRYAQELWGREGINTALVREVADKPTGMAFIMLDERGQNRIIVVPGANDALSAADASAAEREIARARVLIAQFEAPLSVVERVLQLARQHCVTTILNPAPARQVSDRLLSMVDVLTPNESEAQELSGLSAESFDYREAARRLRERGVGTVIITLGDKGAYILDGAGGRVVPGISIPVTDTTGAGDAFTGALAAALAQGKSIDDAVRVANLNGAFCVTRPGVVPGLGRPEDLASLAGATP